MKYTVEINVADKYKERAAANFETAVTSLEDMIAGQEIKVTRQKTKRKK